MIDRIDRNETFERTIEVDMSSEAIAQRIREAGELNELGLSLAKAKPCGSPPEVDTKKPEVDTKQNEWPSGTVERW